MTDSGPDTTVRRDQRQTALPTKITGIVFWGMVLVGVFVSFVQLRGQEHEIAFRYNAYADRLAYSVQQSLAHTPEPSAAKLEALALQLKRETGVAGIDIRVGNRHIIVGNTGAGLEALPRMVRYATGRRDSQPATAFVAIYNPSVAHALAAARKHVLVAMGAIILTFGAILQWVLNLILSYPFERMVEAARDFSTGETARRFDEARDDEFGFLAKFINKALDFSVAQQQALREALERAQRSESELFAEKERAEVALHSIGDAVITTDARAAVEFMNPAAEALAGWSAADAIGRPLAEVLRLVDESTRQLLENPAEKCLRSGEIIDRMDQVILLCPDGRELDIAPSAAPIHDRNQRLVGAIVVFHDVGATRRMTRQLSYLASHDTLTGLYNRREFEKQLQIALDEMHLDNHSHALCYLDMDQFKVVNDRCGHAAGDELLKRFSRMLLGTARESDVIARLGGDEFCMLLKRCDADHALGVAQDLLGKTRNFHFVWQDHSFDVGVSIGVVAISSANMTIPEIMTAADTACYAAKQAGRNRIHKYRTDDNALRQRHGEIDWVSRLGRAMEENRLKLYCQSAIPSSSNTGLGRYYEILLRLVDESGALVPPVTFIPAAERYNFMPQIDRWVVSALLELLRKNDGGCGETFAINISGQSLNDDEFLGFVVSQLGASGVHRGTVCFEIDESAAVADLDRTAHIIATLHDRGCAIAVDHFGSAMRSFSYLKHLKVDYLKISGDLVRNMTSDALYHSMVEATNQIGHAAGIRTIAESAENQNTIAALRHIGVDYAQGYAISDLCPLEDILKLGPQETALRPAAM